MHTTLMTEKLPYRLAAVPALILLMSGCSTTWDSVDLMPAPHVFGDGMLNPLPESDPMEIIPYHGVLYATDREPADPDSRQNYYADERGQLVRLGVANISLHEADVDWGAVREISLLKNRTDRYPLKVTGATEYGILEDTIPGFALREDFGEDLLDGDEEFAAAVNAQLAQSNRKHIYIYVHGYKVIFENPMLVATELWHFLGYDGVMVAYAWPSTPSKWAYIRDTDTSNGYARHFRKLLEFLAQKTDAEEIHIIAYSNGTRLVGRALEQLALMNEEKSRDEVHVRHKLGHAIFVGSDLDREVFAAYLADGALDVPRHMSIYVSDKDKALGAARWLTRRERLGQMVDDNSLSPKVRRLLAERGDHISMIDVSDAEGADTGNGHGYFRSSPWASSDILMKLAYDLTPEERGLVLKTNMPVWEFPPDYMQKLWAALADRNPEFRRALATHQAQADEAGR